ncbi:GNAT family N-acetyltransferase [Salinigranum marinum]|uniref:GNAT family N-acetyltransferase n=1 Tax=Salinigranum marinum TaxID=1515595 RepID=UPI00298A01BE|nr:GNAT family N-acetyltransferase [Salinigranum marinum]
MEYALVGWHDDPGGGPRLRLDYRAFAYAGKFVTSSTGTAVARDDDDPWALDHDHTSGDGDVDGPSRIGDPTVVAAVAFNPDRTDGDTLWLRYVTVRGDRRGEGIGPRLVAFVRERACDRGYARCRIAVNNVFSYEALSKVGFAYTGRETGLAEVVLDCDLRGVSEIDAGTYRRGLDVFRERDLSPEERAFLDEREGAEPPTLVDPPNEA